MKKYSKNNPCPKCGNHSGNWAKYHDGYPEGNFWELPFGGPPEDFQPEEFITRGCWECGYKWSEEPLNK